MYELSGVYEFANANLYGASLGAVKAGTIDALIVARDGQLEEARRRALLQIGATPGGNTPGGGPVVELASGENTKMYIGLGAALFLGWFLFLRKK
jgi:hypothetical protein